MKTLLDFFTTRNKGNRYGARQLAESELGLSRHEWALRKDQPIRQLGLVWALALAALLYGLKPYWGDGK